MGKIIKLDKNLANQIAAGEVVERPVSVVKELIENSIDAGATNISVEITEGGTEQIVITDNGYGIEQSDLPLVLEKYSTSKISSLEDLQNVLTFGFRGEAIASISSVSEFEIQSKTADQSSGYSLKYNNGQSGQIQSIACKNGTKIIVENLFYNTPARLNYLKKPRTEQNHIQDFLQQVSLSNPEIGLEFIADGKKVFKYQQDENIKTRIYSIYGKDFSENILELEVNIYGIHIHGYISDPKVSFGNRNKQSLFINKRVVKSPLISKAISNAYNRFIPHNCFPAYILNIDIDPTQVDINVHPRKLEVRFANESSLFKGVYAALFNKLEQVTLLSTEINTSDSSGELSNTMPGSYIPNNREITNQGNTAPQYYTGSGTKFKSYSPYKDVTPNPNQGNISSAINFSKATLGNNTIEDTGPVLGSNDLHETKLGRIVGQMHNSYIIVQTKEGMQILDQHALAERVIYEKLVKSQYKSKTQGLLIGESLYLKGGEFDILEENKETFIEMGFDLEILSAGNIIVNGIPDFIKKENISQIIQGILSDIGSHNFSKSQTLEEVRNKIFAYASCRSAIKFGHKLNLFEMNKLLNDAVMDYSATCPHGRPVIYEIDLQELQNKYER
ncbi:MAG: DNA mismatch repair endonuclease MutL [Candidatus Gracilibacteria bacterium]|nr:DNA mismatch repair endonuclease MutL [Candidatus Gracilibacteria bacterium]